MKKKIIYIALIAVLGSVNGCNTLDIAPTNIIQDEAVFTDAGMKAYMASLYSRLPIEDFKAGSTSNRDNEDGYFFDLQAGSPETNTGALANRSNSRYDNPAQGYWKSGYQIIRNANYLIEELPAYAASLTEAKTNRWIAEAKFIRAFTYFEMAKRYGGLPIVDKVFKDPNNLEELYVPRSSEEQTYDFILADLDYVIANMPNESEQQGRANKNIAAAFKSRVALTAGSKARYETVWVKEGVALNGIPETRANDYFTQAFKAAKSIENKYSLYMKKWSATDKIATADNYADLFLDPESEETIFARYYLYPDAVHSFDHVFSPPHMTVAYGDRFNPTLDYVELFDGLPKNAKGEIKTTDAAGNYIVYNTLEELFENCEPRLRGTVLLPGQPFKGLHTDIRRGTLIESVNPATPIKKFVADGLTTRYSTVAFYKANVEESSNPTTQEPLTLASGIEINAAGLDGPSSNNRFTVTGFHGRKFLDPTKTAAETDKRTSTQAWIEIRYAEVLLNRAEAALELAQHGVAEVDGVNMQNDAFEQINKIRLRAGAVLLTSASELSSGASLAVGTGVGSYVLAPTRGLQIIRIERRKELAFEHKLWWDMLRWRTADLEVNSRVWRKLNPFLFAKGAVPLAPDYVQGKYIFDARMDERNSRFTIPLNAYYQPIPGADIAASNNTLLQNDQY
ncbi:MAG TPA: RagB/SusD family nutrient uptake outer membrane protein [Pelobium sp.]|nr:RagB/SusD family nutrient uptake outer membrane protein [Pelobium sp.]